MFYTYQDVFNACKYISNRFGVNFSTYLLSGITKGFITSDRKKPYAGVDLDLIDRPYNERLILKYLVKNFSAAQLAKLSTKRFVNKTKIGCHVIREFNRFDIKLPVLKFLMDGNHAIIDQIRRYKKEHPSTIIIGRLFTDNDFNYIHYNDYQKAADTFWLINAHFVEKTRDFVDFYEGQNEPSVASADAVKRYCEFELARMHKFLQEGVKSCHGNFSTGTPDVQTLDPDVFYYKPAIEFGMQHGCLYGRHEYGFPYIGSDYVPSLNFGYSCGRFQLENKIWKLKPLTAITEFGIDPIDNSQARTQDYMEQIHWYNNILLREQHVIGATIFTVGSYPDTRWKLYDLEKINMIEKLKQYNNNRF